LKHRALLAASQDDGTVNVQIKCRLCPDTKLKTWEDIKRRCNTSEAHPLEITFCDQCGDDFTRTDWLKHHRQNPSPAYVTTSSGRAAEKREKTERAHEDFKERLKECLRTGEDIGKPFSQRIKDMFPEFLEAAARWGQQGAESARWTLNDDIISMLTILHVFVFRRFGHLILLFGLLVGFRLLLVILAIPYSYIYLWIRVSITHRVIHFPSPNPPSYHEHEPSRIRTNERSID
jgi:hypothetical protein